jgi:hypothetical protein
MSMSSARDKSLSGSGLELDDDKGKREMDEGDYAPVFGERNECRVRISLKF